MSSEEESYISNESNCDNKEKKKRRPRSAAGSRNYLCGCGKAYLSYPALYTHVKNKHTGIFPQGSVAKRKVTKNEEEDLGEIFNKSVQEYKDQFFDFLGSIEALQLQQPLNEKEWENVFSELKESQSVLLPIVQQMASSKQKESKNITISELFSKYLIELQESVSSKFLQESVAIFIMFLEVINEHGKDFIYNEQEIDKKEIPKEVYANSSTLVLILKMTNLFISEHFPTCLKKYQSKKIDFEFFGFEENQIKNLILFFKFFSTWMYVNEYCKYKLDINVDF